MKIRAYQIFYNEEGRNSLLPGMIPYDNSGRVLKNLENAIILDVWRDKKPEWIDSDYVGVLSWRFREKTGLTMSDIIRQIDKEKDVHFVTPPAFMEYKSPTSRFGNPGVRELAKEADRQGLFPFKIYDHDIEGYIGFCNYFLVKPMEYNNYCKNYLAKAVEWLEAEPGKVRDILKMGFRHREKEYPMNPFFLEALFPIFAHHEGLTYKHIFK
jgi:hypothetical protein